MKIKETPLNVYELVKYTYKNNFSLQKQFMKPRSWTVLIDTHINIQGYGHSDMNSDGHRCDMSYQMIQN
eukprot:1032000-Heterocapsa_arctica.AAC.1